MKSGAVVTLDLLRGDAEDLITNSPSSAKTELLAHGKDAYGRPWAVRLDCVEGMTTRVLFRE